MRNQDYLRKALDANSSLIGALKEEDKAITVVPEGATKDEAKVIESAAAKVAALRGAAHESGVLLASAKKLQNAGVTDAELVEVAGKLAGLAAPKEKTKKK